MYVVCTFYVYVCKCWHYFYLRLLCVTVLCIYTRREAENSLIFLWMGLIEWGCLASVVAYMGPRTIKYVLEAGRDRREEKGWGI